MGPVVPFCLMPNQAMFPSRRTRPNKLASRECKLLTQSFHNWIRTRDEKLGSCNSSTSTGTGWGMLVAFPGPGGS